MNHTTHSILEDTLERWQRRLNRRRAARIVAALCGGWVVGAVAYAAWALSSPYLAEHLPCPVWVPPLVVFGGCLVVGLWRAKQAQLSRQDSAQVVDLKRGTHALFATAEQLLSLSRPLSSEESLCLEEASEALQQHPEQRITWALGPRVLAFPIALACIVALPALPYATPAPPSVEEQPDSKDLKEAARILQNTATKTPEALPPNHPIQRELKSLARRLARNNLSKRKALEDISALKHTVRTTQRTLEQKQARADRATRQAARTLTQSPTTSELGKAMARASQPNASRKQRQQSAQEARRALKKLQKLSPEDRKKAAQALRQASQNASQASLPELGQALENAAQALEQNNDPNLERAAKDLEDALSRSSQQGDALDEVSRALEEAGQRLSGQPAQGSPQGQEGSPNNGTLPRLQPGTGGSSSGEPGGGAGTGHSDSETQGYTSGTQHSDMDRTSDREPVEDDVEYKELYESMLLDDAKRSITTVRGKRNDSDKPPAGTVRGGTQQPQGEDERARRLLESLPDSYMRDAREAVEGEQIPPAYRDSIRDYFDPQK